MTTLLLICVSVALSGAGQLCLKAGAGHSLWCNAATIGGLSLWIASTLLWLWVLRRAPLSYAYCIGSLNYVLVPIVAARCFGESLNAPRIAGMILICGGVALTIYGNFSSPTR